MEVNQFFFGKKGLTAKQNMTGFKDGFHVDVVIRDAVLQQCKSKVVFVSDANGYSVVF